LLIRRPLEAPGRGGSSHRRESRYHRYRESAKREDTRAAFAANLKGKRPRGERTAGRTDGRTDGRTGLTKATGDFTGGVKRQRRSQPRSPVTENKRGRTGGRPPCSRITINTPPPRSPPPPPVRGLRAYTLSAPLANTRVNLVFQVSCRALRDALRPPRAVFFLTLTLRSMPFLSPAPPPYKHGALRSSVPPSHAAYSRAPSPLGIGKKGPQRRGRVTFMLAERSSPSLYRPRALRCIRPSAVQRREACS